MTCSSRPGRQRFGPSDAQAPGGTRWTLLLCGHHYRVSRAALRAAGAILYDESGVPVAAELSDPLAARKEKAESPLGFRALHR